MARERRTVLHGSEYVLGLFVCYRGAARFCLCFYVLIDADIDVKEMHDRVFGEFLFRAVTLESNSQETWPRDVVSRLELARLVQKYRIVFPSLQD